MHQRLARNAERAHRIQGLMGQILGSLPAFWHTQKPWIGEFPAGGVLLHAFAGVGGVAFHVDQVIGDLEHQAETARVDIESIKQCAIAAAFALGSPHAELQACTEQGAGLVLMDVLQQSSLSCAAMGRRVGRADP